MNCLSFETVFVERDRNNQKFGNHQEKEKEGWNHFNENVFDEKRAGKILASTFDGC